MHLCQLSLSDWLAQSLTTFTFRMPHVMDTIYITCYAYMYFYASEHQLDKSHCEFRMDGKKKSEKRFFPRLEMQL